MLPVCRTHNEGFRRFIRSRINKHFGDVCQSPVLCAEPLMYKVADLSRVCFFFMHLKEFRGIYVDI